LVGLGRRGILIGGGIGATAGWYAGTLRLREYPDYSAGEGVSEDVVPRALLTMIGGLSGCVSGYGAAITIGILLEKRRRALT
jgi:hypothetical protein